MTRPSTALTAVAARAVVRFARRIEPRPLPWIAMVLSLVARAASGLCLLWVDRGLIAVGPVLAAGRRMIDRAGDVRHAMLGARTFDDFDEVIRRRLVFVPERSRLPGIDSGAR